MSAIRLERLVWPLSRLSTVLSIALFVSAIIFLAACQDDKGEASDRGLEIGSAVQLLATTQGELAEQALRRLVPHGRAVLPYLEAAFHTAPASGRRNLVVTLRRLGLSESAPLLAHIAAYDENLATARDARQTLNLWASERGPRGEAAKKVLPKVDEVRGAGALLLDP